MKQREPKQSLLDFLWVNYGNRGVAESIESAAPDSIPSYELIQLLLDNLCSKAVGSVTESNGILSVTSLDGILLNSIDLNKELNGIGVKKFGRRTITLDDIDKGSPYLLYLPVYFILLSNDVELLAPIDVYVGGSTKTIQNTILEGTIYSDLKLSQENIKGVIFSLEEDGLAGKVVFKNTKIGLYFSIMTKEEYADSIHDANTLYFIKGEPYMYFGENKIGSNTQEDLSELVLRVTKIEQLLKWEENE